MFQLLSFDNLTGTTGNLRRLFPYPHVNYASYYSMHPPSLCALPAHRFHDATHSFQARRIGCRISCKILYQLFDCPADFGTRQDLICIERRRVAHTKQHMSQPLHDGNRRRSVRRQGRATGLLLTASTVGSPDGRCRFSFPVCRA